MFVLFFLLFSGCGLISLHCWLLLPVSGIFSLRDALAPSVCLFPVKHGDQLSSTQLLNIAFRERGKGWGRGGREGAEWPARASRSFCAPQLRLAAAAAAAAAAELLRAKRSSLPQLNRIVFISAGLLCPHVPAANAESAIALTPNPPPPSATGEMLFYERARQTLPKYASPHSPYPHHSASPRTPLEVPALPTGTLCLHVFVRACSRSHTHAQRREQRGPCLLVSYSITLLKKKKK